MLELSPDHEATIAYFIVCGKNLKETNTNVIIKTEKEDIKVPVSFVTGRIDDIRTHLLAEVEKFFSQYDYVEGMKNEDYRRKEI